MERIAEFEKVSFNQFKKDFISNYGEFSDTEIEKIYNNLVSPKRSTSKSAGYDFTIPFPVTLKVGETRLIPTGFKCRIDDSWALILIPRSSLGFKYRLQLDNTIGLIDADYYNSEKNEGHIMAKVTNDGLEGKIVSLEDRFCQGIFFQYGITESDDANGIRTGGFGSTDNSIS